MRGFFLGVSLLCAKVKLRKGHKKNGGKEKEKGFEFLNIGKIIQGKKGINK